MEAEEFIDRLSKSDESLMKSTANSLKRWKSMDHNKECLETFLNHNIAVIEFTTTDNEVKKAVCCSNTAFVELFNSNLDSADAKSRKNLPVIRSGGMRSRSMKSVTTWDLLKNDYCTINLRSWKISIPFLEISTDNILLLVEKTRGILRKRRSERTKRP